MPMLWLFVGFGLGLLVALLLSGTDEGARRETIERRLGLR